MLEDGLIAFFSAVGLTTCVWLAAGVFLSAGKCRNPDIRLVLPVSGAAPAMEADLRELLRMRHSLPDADVILEDRGLTEEARDVAECLCRRFDGVYLEPAGHKQN
jgi:hypothetical protein